jgi:hypothetical protein
MKLSLDAGTPGQPHVLPASPSHPLAVLKGLGWLLVGTGLVGNEWVLAKLLSDDGIVEIQNRVAVGLFDILCIALGLFCVRMAKRLTARDVFRRLSQAYPGTVACCIGCLLTVFLVVCTEGIFYGLNHCRQEQTVAEVSWIRLTPPHAEAGSSEHPPPRVQGWSIPDPLLGHTLPSNVQIIDKTVQGGTVIHQATYTTDAYHRRITPLDSLEQRHQFLLFFGCSMTFGLGVNDDETMPFYVAQYASHYRPYNYGVSGYGPHYVLAQLQRGALPTEIQEHTGIAIYTFIDHHINRAIGTMRVYNQWEQHAPFYTLDAHDRLVRRGDFTSGRPLLSFLYWVMGRRQILQYYNINFPPRIREEHIQLTARIITEARMAFHQQFPNAEFYVLFYPGVRHGHDLIPYLATAGVKYLDYSHLIDWPQSEFTQADSAHPTAQGHRVVAAQLAKDLGIVDGERGR